MFVSILNTIYKSVQASCQNVVQELRSFHAVVPWQGSEVTALLRTDWPAPQPLSTFVFLSLQHISLSEPNISVDLPPLLDRVKMQVTWRAAIDTSPLGFARLGTFMHDSGEPARDFRESCFGTFLLSQPDWCLAGAADHVFVDDALPLTLSACFLPALCDLL